MTERAIVDAGSLVAFFDADDEHHEWAIESFAGVRNPLLTCEPVLAEAMYLLRARAPAQDKVLDWVARGSLSIDFNLAADVAAVRRLMKKYRDLPMSFADACLVRMADAFDDHVVCTLDADFRVYRKDGGAAIRLVIPDEA